MSGELDGIGVVPLDRRPLVWGQGMTVIRLNDGDEDEGRRILKIAERKCEEILDDLEACQLFFRDRDDLPDTELKRVLQNLSRSLSHVFDERKRFDELRKKQLGVVHDFALDFDDARNSIGGRLDRLRAAQRAGKLSE
ncbi:hypothetical protein [Palleronia rufa]|uniref:hypothetical protein n=1 Tax=Palleronia rufa TaxID=1530186 RepID=UPI001F2AA838|nr:hypothetical protein [Palleronia rufa]